MKKKWKFGLKVADSHSEPGNLQKRGNFHSFIIFSFFFIFLARGTWNPGKPWKTMKNNGKPSKTKENEKKMKLQMKKKWKFGLKVADSHSEPGNLQKLEENFIFLSFFHFFIIFLARGTWNPGKPWKTMKNNGKPSKTKENEKKMKLQMKKKRKFWTQSCRFSLRTRKSSKTRGNFHFFYHLFFIFLARGTWNPGKPWKAMKNNGKPSKTKENEKKMKL